MKKCIMLVFILAVGMFIIVGCGDKTAKSDVSDADGAVTDALNPGMIWNSCLKI